MREASGDPGAGRAGRLAALAVVALALVPGLATLGVPWIAEDAAILERVHTDGLLADWGRPQYGMHLLLFWRPVVSTTWALQERVTGIDPAALRALNLGLHALAAWLALVCARRLGAGPRGAFLAGAWVALFPAQGGTVVWLAGRTDLLCAVFLLAAVALAFSPRARVRAAGSAVAAFLACASKEFGFLTPLAVLLPALGRGDGGVPALRRAAPATVGTAVAFLWRWAALGGLSGGYPVQLPGPVEGLLGSARAVGAAVPWSVLLWPTAAFLGLRATGARGRTLAAGGALAVLLCVPLAPLLADGFLEPENARLLFLPGCAIGLALGLAWGGRERRWRLAFPAACVLVLARLAPALGDARDWAAAAHLGEARVAEARAAVAGAAPGDGPVLFEGFPVSHRGAYCLGYGLSSRFRPPFPSSPRPVWPWRQAFVPDPARARTPLVAARPGGGWWPLDDAPPLPELAVALAEHGRAPVAPDRILLDTRVVQAAEDRSPVLHLDGGPAGAGVEALVVTEIGYEAFPLFALDDAGAGGLSLMRFLGVSNGFNTPGQLLAQAADLGATRAYVVLRAGTPEEGPTAASRWLELAWVPELLEHAAGTR